VKGEGFGYIIILLCYSGCFVGKNQVEIRFIPGIPNAKKPYSQPYLTTKQPE
jgi:hypothetical protein